MIAGRFPESIVNSFLLLETSCSTWWGFIERAGLLFFRSLQIRVNPSGSGPRMCSGTSVSAKGWATDMGGPRVIVEHHDAESLALRAHHVDGWRSRKTLPLGVDIES